MNQRALLAVLGITIVIAGFAGAWFLFDTSASEREVERGRVLPGAGTGEGATELATPAAETGTTLETPAPVARGDANAPTEQRRELEATATEGPEPTRVVRGFARFAEGTPGDEKALVLALTHPLRARRIYREDGPADAAWDPDVDSNDLVDSAEVAPDGSFALDVPASTEEVHLVLTGRYTLSRASTTYTLPADDLTVTGELGSWVTGRLVPSDPGGDPSDIEVDLGPDISGGFDAFNVGRQFWEVDDTTGSDGAFELRAVPAGQDSAIRLKPERFAAKIEQGIEPQAGQHVELEIALMNGGTLRGRVVDEDRRAVAGAEIAAFLPGLAGRILDEVRTVESDAQGDFELPHVPAGAIELEVRHEEHEDLRHKIAGAIQENEVVDGVVVTMKRGLSISGTVRFPDGSPAANAKVSASLARDAASFGSFQNRVEPATADEAGRFAVRGLEEEAYDLIASVDSEEEDDDGGSGWRADADEIQAGTNGVALTLEGLTSLQGLVTDLEGRPVDEYTVVCTKKGTGGQFGIGAETQRRGIEDEEGRFEVPALSSGIWQVRIEAQGFAGSEVQEATLPQAGGEELVFMLERGAAVLGRVLDVAGNPVVGARVTLELDLQAQLASIGGSGPPETYSEAEGEFELEDLDASSVTLVASFEGFAKSEGVTVDVLPGEVVEGVELQLRVGGTLTGEVLDNDGDPAPGRMVIVQRTPSYDSQHILTSDADGAFRVEHLEPGSWQVVSMTNFEDVIDSASADSEEAADFMNDMKLDIVDIVDGETAHVVLGAPPEDPVKIIGRLEHGGDPVRGSAVSFLPEDSEGLSDLKITTTSAEGKFEVTLDHPGEYLITVQNAVGGGQQNSVEFRETIPEEPEHRLTLALPLGKISGTVYGPDGDPLGGCRITLNTEGGIAYGSFLGGHFTESQTKSDGSYEIAYLDAGSYTVAAGGEVLGGLFGTGASGGRALRSGVRVDEDEHVSGLDFHLSEPGELTVSVVGPNGQPVRGAAVFVRDDQGRLLERFSMVATDGTGRFTYRGLAAGSYTVSARLGDQVSEESLLVSVPEGGATDVQVGLDAGTVLRVTVIENSGEEIGAVISVLDEDGHEMSGMYTLEEIMESYQRGFSSKEQRIGPVPPGTYQVLAMTDDGRTTSKPVTVRGTADRRVKLRLK